MRLVTVVNQFDKREWLGVLYEDGSDRLVDLKTVAEQLQPAVAADDFSSMMHLINAGDATLDRAKELFHLATQGKAGAAGERRIEEINYRTPIPDPPQIRDCLMFEDHLVNAYSALRQKRAQLEPDPDAALVRFEEQGLYKVPEIWYELPLYYKANRFSVIGHDQDVIKPGYTDMLDYELEFACVLKNRIKDVSESEAAASIFGYTIFNDVSARDIQSREMQGQLGPAKGKDFDTGNVIGPCIVTADAVDAKNLTMIARINGEEIVKGNSGTAHWSFEKVIAYMSMSETLVPGEMIGSGTVGGGCGLESGRFLEVGDVIELEVEGIGVLRNKVTAPQ